ncbi:MauE/DoxX family redox-associated membrane protein [Streptomyces sp. NPDC052020]|uniref:MauE/DoxX family redox-associated membrane protein n=1 Tax=Streptomyces sp. NPDC052020 TaxID=3155677 RepID=UPI0034137F7D
MGDVVPVMVRVLLGMLFMAAAWTKAVRPVMAQKRWLESVPVVPAWARAPVAVGLPAAESLAGVMLLTGAFGLAGAMPAGVLLMMFTAVVLVMLARGDTADCGCFGGGQTVSWRIVLRNLLLISAWLLVMLGPARWGLATAAWPVETAVPVAATAFLLAAARRQGRRRAAPAKADTAASAVPVPDEHPSGP